MQKPGKAAGLAATAKEADAPRADVFLCGLVTEYQFSCIIHRMSNKKEEKKKPSKNKEKDLERERLEQEEARRQQERQEALERSTRWAM